MDSDTIEHSNQELELSEIFLLGITTCLMYVRAATALASNNHGGRGNWTVNCTSSISLTTT